MSIIHVVISLYCRFEEPSPHCLQIVPTYLLFFFQEEVMNLTPSY